MSRVVQADITSMGAVVGVTIEINTWCEINSEEDMPWVSFWRKPSDAIQNDTEPNNCNKVHVYLPSAS